MLSSLDMTVVYSCDVLSELPRLGTKPASGIWNGIKYLQSKMVVSLSVSPTERW